ncbi:MAG: TIGR02594 family protein [Pseudolabrys sp.]|jgi:uncharacterized protein (TIGR02594 family)
MQFKTQAMLAIGCVSLVAFSVPAFAAPAPQATKKEQHAQVKHARTGQKPRVATDRDEGRLVTQPVQMSANTRKPVSGWPKLIVEARKYLGTNPTGRDRLWCARFMNFILAKIGYTGTGSDAARSFAQYGHRISGPEIGAIAVLARGKNGGHVGIVTGLDPHGNPIIISGNHGHRVGEGVYPRARVIAYVMPTGMRATPASASQGTQTAQSHSLERELDSPIAELIAAIQAESSHAETPQARVAQQARAVPQRVVQQMPQETVAPAQPPARRDVPLDPALARFLGVKDSDLPRPPQRGGQRTAGRGV